MAKSKKRLSKKRPSKMRPSKPSGSAAEIARLTKAVRSRDLIIKNLRHVVSTRVPADVVDRHVGADEACKAKVTELEGALAKAYADIAQLTAEKRAGEGQPPQ